MPTVTTDLVELVRATPSKDRARFTVQSMIDLLGDLDAALASVEAEEQKETPDPPPE